MNHIIRQVFFSPDGVDLDFMATTDLRAGGEVYQSHHLSIARGGQLAQAIADVENALELLLTAGLQLWSTSAVFDPATGADGEPEEGDDDDDEYDG